MTKSKYCPTIGAWRPSVGDRVRITALDPYHVNDHKEGEVVTITSIDYDPLWKDPRFPHVFKSVNRGTSRGRIEKAPDLNQLLEEDAARTAENLRRTELAKAPPVSGGLKFDDGKLPTELIAPEAIVAVVHSRLDELDEYDVLEDGLAELAAWYARKPNASLHRVGWLFLQAVADRQGINVTGAWTLVAEVLRFGAKKYAPRNWEKGISYTRCYAAALRHVFAHRSGEKLDPETNLPHMAHAICEVMFLIAFEARGLGVSAKLDDRPLPFLGGPAVLK